jgi:hypothetical protein
MRVIPEKRNKNATNYTNFTFVVERATEDRSKGGPQAGFRPDLIGWQFSDWIAVT